MTSPIDPRAAALLALSSLPALAAQPAEDLGSKWGTETEERKYYRVVSLPIPEELTIEAGAFTTLPDGRIAVGTRHGDIYLVDGVDDPKPEPTYTLFASGMDEIFGLEADPLWQCLFNIIDSLIELRSNKVVQLMIDIGISDQIG